MAQSPCCSEDGVEREQKISSLQVQFDSFSGQLNLLLTNIIRYVKDQGALLDRFIRDIECPSVSWSYN